MMNRKTSYEAPEALSVMVRLEGVINTSTQSSASPNMSTLTSEQEDWGSWE